MEQVILDRALDKWVIFRWNGPDLIIDKKFDWISDAIQYCQKMGFNWRQWEIIWKSNTIFYSIG